MAKTLFQRYGGFAAVSKIVMSFYDKALDSDVIGHYFENVDMRRLIDHQTKFVSQVLGGPVTYTDEALKQLHAHLSITDEAFAEMVALFEETLEDFDFEPRDVAYVVRELEIRKPWIVNQTA